LIRKTQTYIIVLKVVQIVRVMSVVCVVVVVVVVVDFVVVIRIRLIITTVLQSQILQLVAQVSIQQAN